MSSSSFVSKDSFGAGTATDAALHPNKSFSIIFRGARTLDLMMPSDNRDDMLDALDLVLRAYQAAKVTVAKDVLLLRYIWLDVDKVRLLYEQGYSHVEPFSQQTYLAAVSNQYFTEQTGKDESTQCIRVSKSLGTHQLLHEETGAQ
jgi:hypothetical protein